MLGVTASATVELSFPGPIWHDATHTHTPRAQLPLLNEIFVAGPVLPELTCSGAGWMAYTCHTWQAYMRRL